MTDEERAQLQAMHDELMWISFKLQQRADETRAEMVLRVADDLRALHKLVDLLNDASKRR